MQAMIQNEFIKTFGNEGFYLLCTCWYYKTYAYEFTYHVRGIEQKNANNFSMIGDIIDVDADDVAPSFKTAIVPKHMENVAIVYNFSKGTLNFTTRKAGLVIKADDNGSSNWGKLLEMMALYKAGYSKIARI